MIEDEGRLTRWAQQAREIEQAYRDAELLRAPERRMPSFFDEVWDHCSLHVNQAWESHRVREHIFALEGGASAADWPALQARLTAGHAGLIGQPRRSTWGVAFRCAEKTSRHEPVRLSGPRR